MDETYRKLLTYAYNIVGSYEDAEDLVQDTLEKYIAVDKSKIENERNYLIRTVINLSINFKKRNKRTAQYGVWLPEPVATDNPASKLLKEHTANYTLLVLMEKLNARERAVFILKEGFDYTHEEISNLLEISIANSRQLLTRAKKAMCRAPFKIRQQPDELLSRYINAIVHADIRSLEELLVDDIRIMADGGQKVNVVKDIEVGREATAKLLQYVYGMFLEAKDYTFAIVNHQPAVCFYKNNKLYNCQIFSVSPSGHIENIYSIVDPDKLSHFQNNLE